jgi:hypothetical protein
VNADAGVATGSTSAAAIAVTARILVTAHSSKFLAAFGSMKASRSEARGCGTEKGACGFSM